MDHFLIPRSGHVQMDLQAFIDRIKNAVLLSEEDRQYFLSRAADYTPEIRTKMTDILKLHEDKLIQYANKQTKMQFQNRLTEMKQLMMEAEKDHEAEIAEAERQLEEDLKNLKI